MYSLLPPLHASSPPAPTAISPYFPEWLERPLEEGHELVQSTGLCFTWRQNVMVIAKSESLCSVEAVVSGGTDIPASAWLLNITTALNITKKTLIFVSEGRKTNSDFKWCRMTSLSSTLSLSVWIGTKFLTNPEVPIYKKQRSRSGSDIRRVSCRKERTDGRKEE